MFVHVFHLSSWSSSSAIFRVRPADASSCLLLYDVINRVLSGILLFWSVRKQFCTLRAALFRKKQEILDHRPGPRHDAYRRLGLVCYCLWGSRQSMLIEKQTWLHAVTLVVLMGARWLLKLLVCVAVILVARFLVFVLSEDVGVDVVFFWFGGGFG